MEIGETKAVKNHVKIIGEPWLYFKKRKKFRVQSLPRSTRNAYARIQQVWKRQVKQWEGCIKGFCKIYESERIVILKLLLLT